MFWLWEFCQRKEARRTAAGDGRMGEIGLGGRVELLSRGITPVLFPLMAVGLMSPLKSKAGTLFITLIVCTG